MEGWRRRMNDEKDQAITGLWISGEGRGDKAA
jgi:hypothetical protein